MRLPTLLLLATATFAVATFAAGCVTARPGGDAADIVGPTWQLTAIGDDATVPDASLTFGADGRVSGTAGCNRLTGTYELNADGELDLSALGATRMACPPAAMEQERRVLGALAAAERADVEAGRLVLLGGDGDRLLTFEPAGSAASGTATLTGTVTYLPRIALPPDAALTVRLLDVSLADAPSTTLAETTVSTAGQSVPIPFSLGYDPGEIDARHRYAVRAEVRSRDGALLWTTDTVHRVLTNGAPSSGVEVRLVQVQTAPGDAGRGLVGVEWRLRELDTPGADALSLGPDAPYTLRFEDGGRFSGRVDCNRIGGAFRIDVNGDLSLKLGPSTAAACPPGSAADDFLRTLDGVDDFDVTGDRLTLSGDAGTLVFVRDGAAGGADTGALPGRDRPITSVFECGDDVQFTTRTGPDELSVWLPQRFGRPYVALGRVPTASGAAYQDGSVTVRTEGDEARLEVDGEVFTGCTNNARLAAWEDAKLSGWDFRAVGQEPGWELQVRRDLETAVGRRASFVYDYGTREATLVPTEQATEGRRTLFSGSSTDGRPFTLALEGVSCTDVMSGERYETTVTVTLDGTAFRGCGRALH